MDRAFRKIIFTIIMIAICGGVFIFSTITWFQNTDISIQNVDISISSLESILFSTNQKEWKKVLSNEDFKTGIPSFLEGLSTSFELDEKEKIIFYKVSTNIEDDKDYYLSKKVKNPKVVYLSFSIQSDQDGMLTLHSSSDVLTSDFDKSIRVAFLENHQLKLVWEPHSDVHTEEGIHRALVYYDKIIGLGPGEEILSYRGVKKDITKKDKVLLTSRSNDYFSTISPKNNENGLDCFAIKKGITDIEVYLWIESQDVDYDENFDFQRLQLSLQFSSSTK